MASINKTNYINVKVINTIEDITSESKMFTQVLKILDFTLFSLF